MEDIAALYSCFLEFPEIVIDSREAKPGSIFFALRGETFDGNQFAPDALQSGCAYAVVDDPVYRGKEKFILVDDTLEALQAMAQYHREALEIPILAITGSNGKTTTKELVAAVLSRKYATGFTRGNFNNHIGVPLTLLQFTKKTEIGVVEMGANHQGEIAALCQIARPNYGLITNIGQAHLEGFGSFKGVVKAKSELYHFIAQNKGMAFVHGNDSLLMAQIEKHGVKNYYTYGKEKIFDCMGMPYDNRQGVVVFRVGATGKNLISTKLYGDYNFDNCLAAVCIGLYFDIPFEKIKEAIEGYVPANNRSQILETGKNRIVLDAYNANPTSMASALAYFLSLHKEPKAVILGDMLELGEYAREEHGKVLDLLIANKVKTAYLVGKEFKKIEKAYPYTFVEGTGQLKSYLKDNPVKGYNILIKGSRGIQLESLVEVL